MSFKLNPRAKATTEVNNSTGHIYYNIVIPHNETDNPFGAPTPARFIEERVQPLIDDPNDYNLAIVRFQVPSQLIPLNIYAVMPYLLPGQGIEPVNLPLNTDPNKSVQSITIGYLGTYIQVFLEYIPNSTASIPPLPFTALNTHQIYNNPYYFVQSYQVIVDMMNTALQIAYGNPAFQTSPPRVNNAPAPYFVFNQQTELFSLVASKWFDPNYANANTLQIFMNTQMYSFFLPSFEKIYNGFNTITAPSGTNNQILIKNNGNNDPIQLPLPLLTNQVPWSALVNYSINTPVSYLGVVYNSLINNNLNNIPSSIPNAFWNAIYPSPAYSGTQTYNLGNFVTYQGNQYVSLQNANLAHLPSTSPTFWQLYSSNLNPPSVWLSTATYGINAIVNYLGNYYINLTGANTGNPVTDVTDWALTNIFNSFVMTQEFVTVNNWNSAKTIVFTSGSMPVNNEQIPNNASLISGTSSGAITQMPIITDFELPQNQQADNRTILQYFNQGEYRLVSLKGSQPLRKFDIQVYWADAYNALHPLLIPHHQSVSIKILFRKKMEISGLKY